MSAVGIQLLAYVEAMAMGGRLGDLSANAHRCLLVMAFTAHDKGTNDAPARTYFRGWDHLARAALCRDVYDAPAKQAVARAVRELTDAGLIKYVGRRNGMRQGRAMYEVMGL